MSLDRTQRNEWIFASLFIGFSVFLLGFYAWLRFFPISVLTQQIEDEKRTLTGLQEQQNQFLEKDLRDLFTRYSDGIAATEVVLAARDEVFTGAIDDDTAEPVVILDYPDFLKLFRALLGKKSVISNLTISKAGQLSFLVQTGSYALAGQQMAALKFGLSPARQQEVLVDEGGLEHAETIPVLLRNIDITSVARREVTGQAEDVPAVLRDGEAIYSFIVQAEINPEYYFWQNEKRETENEK